MEVIRLSGYTEDEKVNIAIRYLLPKQIKNHGLKPEEIAVSESAIRDIVRYHTREAGVRALEREISKICRKVVKSLVLKKRATKTTINAKNLGNYLGRAPLYLRHGGEAQPGGAGHRPGVDRGGRRAAHHRERGHARQGQGGVHRQARRGDAGVDPGRAHRGAQPLAEARHRRGLLPEERHPHPPAGGRHAQGRAERGHRHLHRDGVGAERASRCAPMWR